MQVDVDALASEVVIVIQKALAPVLERLSATEARIAMLGDLRDRVVTIETKSAQPVVLPVVEAPTVDLSPVLERVSAAEARLAQIGDIRDRVVVMETKMVQPVVVPAVVEHTAPALDVAVLERVAAAEARLSTLGDLRDRVVAIETKSAAPVPVVELGDVRERLIAVETRTDGLVTAIAEVTGTTKAVAVLSERLAVVETRAPVPGPAGTNGADGKDGAAGKDGTAGKDGADGLGFDDLLVEQKDDRSFTIKAARGERVKEIGTAIFPVQIQRGVYLDGKTYAHGDLVTWGGSQWFCQEPTSSKPGEGSKAWTLVVKRGRDGKDGRDGQDAALPVVSVGKRS